MTAIRNKLASPYLMRFLPFRLSPSWFSPCLVLWLSLSLACNPQAAPDSSDPNINGGRNVSPRSRSVAMRSTVALTTAKLQRQGRSFCSGTLVAPRVVLTAAHCVLDDKDEFLARDIFVTHGAEVAKSKLHAVEAIAVHASYAADTLDNYPFVELRDLSLLRLQDASIPQARPAALAAADLRLTSTSSLSVAGYGVSRGRDEDDTGRLRQVRMRLSHSEQRAKVLLLRGAVRPGQVISDAPFGQDQLLRLRAGACAGDSGGPAYLLERAHAPLLVGVTSFGSELPMVGEHPDKRYCIGENGFVDIRAYAKMLGPVIAAMNQSEPVVSSELEFDSLGLRARNKH